MNTIAVVFMTLKVNCLYCKWLQELLIFNCILLKCRGKFLTCLCLTIHNFWMGVTYIYFIGDHNLYVEDCFYLSLKIETKTFAHALLNPPSHIKSELSLHHCQYISNLNIIMVLLFIFVREVWPRC